MKFEDFDKDLFAKHNQICLLELKEGYAKAAMSIDSDIHHNGLGQLHGGAIFTLADFAFAAACNSREEIAVAIDVHISFVRVAKGNTLTAVAKEKSVQKAIGIYEVEVFDENDTVIAMFHGTAYRKRPKSS